MNETKTGFFDGVKKIFKKKSVVAGLLIVMIGLAYFGYQTTKGNGNSVSYAMAAVSKGTLIVSVSGTGQVDASSQVDVKPKVSGQVLALKVRNGDTVKAGDIIAQIDTKDAQKSVRDAALGLENAQLAMTKLKEPADKYTITQATINLEQSKIDLEKLKKPPTEYDLLSAQNSVSQAKRDLQTAQDNQSKTNLDTNQTLQQAYNGGYTAISNAYLDLPDLVKDAKHVIWEDATNSASRIDYVTYYKLILGANSDFITALESDYAAASKLFDDSFLHFKNVLRTADQKTQYQLLDETLTTAKAVSRSLESSRNVLDAVVKVTDYNIYNNAATVDLLRPIIQADITIINRDVTALQTAIDTVDTTSQNSPMDQNSVVAAITAAEDNVKVKQAFLDKLVAGATGEDIATAQKKVEQMQQSLDKLLAGVDPLDVQAQKLAIKGKQNTLSDAQQTLADYNVRAPFDGVISNVAVTKGETISSGTVAATLITNQLMAEVSLNEVDVAKVKVGEKSTLTFDAITDLSISGEVAEIDTIGTVTQGVVSYNVKIALDTQDVRIKPGMSVSAAIITEVKTDVLMIPNGAIKTQGSTSYVEMIDQPIPASQGAADMVMSLIPPRQQTIEVGLANDTSAEIISGLNEGDQIVTRTTSSGTKTPAATGASALRVGGVGGGARGFGG